MADASPDSSLSAQRRQAAGWMRAATYASVAVAFTLITIKAIAFYLTGSIALLASLVDSGLDAIASLVTFFAVRHALEPPDHEHRFGHGKAEAMAGLAQAIIISGSALFILFEAGRRLLDPQPVGATAAGVIVIAVSIALTLALVVFQKFVVARTGSLAVSADELHYTGDLLINVGVIIALLLAQVPALWFADPLIGLAIAAYIAYAAWGIFRQSADQLMDREMEDADRERITEIVMAHPQVHSMHDLRTRLSGTQAFIQLHLELDAHITLIDAHHIADEVEAEILAAYPLAEVLIHQDPAGVEMTTRLERS